MISIASLIGMINFVITPMKFISPSKFEPFVTMKTIRYFMDQISSNVFGANSLVKINWAQTSLELKFEHANSKVNYLFILFFAYIILYNVFHKYMTHVFSFVIYHSKNSKFGNC